MREEKKSNITLCLLYTQESTLPAISDENQRYYFVLVSPLSQQKAARAA